MERLQAQQKLTKSTNRILLKDIISVQVRRGKCILYTKSNYDEKYVELVFLKKNVWLEFENQWNFASNLIDETTRDSTRKTR
jgi:hypothetical protein